MTLQMTMDWTIVLSTFVGAFLASGTGYLFELNRERNRLKKLRELLKTAICDDLEHTLSLYEKVSDEWEKTKTIWFATLTEIRESRFTYQHNKDWIHLFGADLRRRIFRYYLQSEQSINLLENFQRRKYEYEASLKKTIRDLQLKNEDMSYDQALREALHLMESEDKEYNNLTNTIADTVSKVHRFKNEATGLLNDLKKVK